MGIEDWKSEKGWGLGEGGRGWSFAENESFAISRIYVSWEVP